MGVNRQTGGEELFGKPNVDVSSVPIFADGISRGRAPITRRVFMGTGAVAGLSVVTPCLASPSSRHQRLRAMKWVRITEPKEMKIGNHSRNPPFGMGVRFPK
jgi:hypothetical protein